jgi:hypothetical protein
MVRHTGQKSATKPILFFALRFPEMINMGPLASLKPNGMLDFGKD